MKAAFLRCGLRCGMVVLLTTVLHGCGSDMNDLRQYIDGVKARPQSKIEPLPQIKPYETYAYPANLRDPFTPSLEPAAGSTKAGPRPNPNRHKEALEDFPLDTLRLVGNLGREKEEWSLVKAPDGSVYRVQPGNYLGQNEGHIIKVTDQGIELVELIEDGQGGWIERPASLTLSEETTEGGKK